MATDRELIEGEHHYAKLMHWKPTERESWVVFRKSDDKVLPGQFDNPTAAEFNVIQRDGAANHFIEQGKQHIKSPSPETPGLREIHNVLNDLANEDLEGVDPYRVVRLVGEGIAALDGSTSRGGIVLEGELDTAYGCFYLDEEPLDVLIDTGTKLDLPQPVRIEITPLDESGGEQ